jgi:hypothetical protein
MRRLRLGLVVLGLLAAGVARGDTIFFDGELAASSFLVAEIDTNEGGTASTAPEGTGNPGSALRVQITLAPSAGPSRLLAAYFHRTAYDPMFDGGFASVDYDEDHRLLSGGGGGQATGVALRQNGSIFIHQVGTTPEREWTHASATGLTVDDFDHVSGPQQVLNFSTGAPKIEVGFFRANSHSGAAGEGSQIVGIDNWRVALVPKCAVDADCDEGDACSASACVDQICRRTRTVCSDGDPCTVDACTQGVCSNLPLQCDDGASCTTDRCVAGTCLHDLTADPVAVQAKIGSFVSILERPPCSVEVPQFKLIKRLGKKLRQARAKIGKADLALAIPRITRLLGRASTLIAGARDALAKGETEGRVSPACANDLRAFLDDLRICVEGVPRQ